MPAFLTHLACATVVALLLAAAGQPLFTEDTWWHLSMGAVYVEHGPRLAADPLLHTAEGPPAPAAWLADVVFHGFERAFGFHGLRALHAALVGGILAFAWASLRRASRSAPFASLGTLAFGALAAYRLFQLRPELFTIAAALLLVRWLVADGKPPRWRRVLAAVAVMAVWANLHAGFVLGPVLVAVAAAGAAFGAVVEAADPAAARARAARLAAAAGLGLAATLLNPEGAAPHGLYFAAGVDTPTLALVADEWARVDLLAWPVPRLPPSLLNWALVWLFAVGGLVFAATALRGAARSVRIDWALAATALFGIAAMLFAVRFLWLGILPIWFAASLWRLRVGSGEPASRRWREIGVAAAAVGIAASFVACGDWPMISRGVRSHTYAKPYPPIKYHAHAVWFLRDTGLEGRLWNDYGSGNFLGYWLAPRLRVFVNGSLNVSVDAMEARHAIERRGFGSGVPITDWLDRYGVDVFFGTGEPIEFVSSRGPIPTTTHLESTPGWIPVFRNLRSGVYLRANERNAANRERVARYYADAGVPFDSVSGLQVERVVRENPEWAIAHGLVPVNYPALLAAARSLDPSRSAAARDRLATVYAALGLYERAEALDRRIALRTPDAIGAARRRVWCLLHLGRDAETREAASALAAIAAPDDALSQALLEAARLRPTLAPDDAAALVATLPVFTVSEGAWLLYGYMPPPVRFPE